MQKVSLSRQLCMLDTGTCCSACAGTAILIRAPASAADCCHAALRHAKTEHTCHASYETVRSCQYDYADACKTSPEPGGFSIVTAPEHPCRRASLRPPHLKAGYRAVPRGEALQFVRVEIAGAVSSKVAQFPRRREARNTVPACGSARRVPHPPHPAHLGVLRCHTRRSTIGPAEHDGAVNLARRHVQRLCRRVDNLVDGLHCEVPGHELAHGAQARESRAHRDTRETRLREGQVSARSLQHPPRPP